VADPQASTTAAIASSPVGTTAATAGEADANGTVPGTTIRLFLSSTFADFQTERDALQRHVFPELRRLCAASGYRLQPIDLRWGVSEAAGSERQTLRICFDELERCRQLSPDLFLLILLGQRYGSTLLPPQIPTALVVRLFPVMTPEERTHFAAVYRLDENAMPAEYVLLRPEGPVQAEDEQLRQALVRAGRASGVGDEDLLLFAGSATHLEIQLGLLGDHHEHAPSSAGVLCAVRTFTGITGEPQGPVAERFVERDAGGADRLRQLTGAVLDRLPSDQVLRYTVAWREDEHGDEEVGPAFDEDALVAAYLGLLRPKLEAVIAAREAQRIAAAAQGRDAAALANSNFEHERAARVEGRESELAHLSAYLAGQSGRGLPVVVAGAAGSGKSTLLAEAVTRAAAAHPGAALVVRYCGVTPGTESLRTLLNDLHRTIAHAYGQPQPESLSDEGQLIGPVAAQLATLPATSEQPLLLVIDAIDQLGAHTQRTDWLPPRLAPHVRVIVSVLADRPELGYLRARLPAEQVLTLAPLEVEAGRAILHDLLATAPARRLTPAQEDAVVVAFAAQGLPLHLYLLATQARGWRSFDLPRLGSSAGIDASQPLPESTPRLLDILMQEWEAPERSGDALVARALADLAAARYGLAEDELLDLLARDELVRDEERTRSPYSPPIAPHLPLPMALWARLHTLVAPLLTERQADAGVRLFTFYHGQLRAAVETRYLTSDPVRADRHRALADYFSDQPWRLGPTQWNWRKIRELVTQCERAGDRPAAEQALGGLADEMEQSPDAQTQDARAAAGTVAVMSSLKDHLETGGYWQLGLRLYAQELASVRAVGNRAAEGETLANMGLLADHLGHTEEAARDYEQALVLLREMGNRVGEGSTLNNLGTLALARGRLDEAGSYLEQALAIRHEVGDRAGEGGTLNNLGQLADQLGQREGAAQAYAQALAIQREIGDRPGEAVTLNNLGQLAYHLGRAEEAASFFQQALVILHEVGDRPGEAVTLANLGSLAGRLGQWDEAGRDFEQALAIQREVGDRSGAGTSLTNLGTLAAHRGQPQEAMRNFEQALEILRAVGDRPGEANALNSLGALARDQGRLDEAAQYYAQSLAIVREMGERAIEGALLNNLGSLTRAQGRLEEAAHHFEQALAIERAVGDRTGEGHTLNNLGALVREQGRLDEAGRYFEQALTIRREVGDREGEAATLTNLGALARVQGRPDEAARDYAEALAICEAIGAVDLATTVRGNIAYLKQQQQQQQQQQYNEKEQQQQQRDHWHEQRTRPRRGWWWPLSLFRRHDRGR
jgi:tetratricopeptide (TPR) repeat protein